MTFDLALPFTLAAAVLAVVAGTIFRKRHIPATAWVATIFAAVACAGAFDMLTVAWTGVVGGMTPLRAIWYALAACGCAAVGVRHLWREVLRRRR